MKEKIAIKVLSKNAVIPTYGSTDAAGADLYADIEHEEIIKAHETKFIKTGIALAIPKNLVGLLCARSGIASKRGLAPANKVGIIDSDYRGEIIVALHNHTNQDEKIEPRERIAQILFVPFYQGDFEVVDDLSSTDRGDGRFGSTGNK